MSQIIPLVTVIKDKAMVYFLNGVKVCSNISLDAEIYPQFSKTARDSSSCGGIQKPAMLLT